MPCKQIRVGAYSLKASTSFRGVKKDPTLGTMRLSRLRLGSCTTESASVTSKGLKIMLLTAARSCA